MVAQAQIVCRRAAPVAFFHVRHKSKVRVFVK
jgi:hypothetical protein